VRAAAEDVGQAFGSGMVLAAKRPLPEKMRMYMRSCCGSRVIVDPATLLLYQDSPRLQH